MRGSTFPTGIAKRIAAFAIAILSLVAIEAGLAGGATAAVAPDCAATPAGGNLCVLSPSAASALNLGGGSTLTVAKNIVVNSSSANAATATGGATASATAIGGPGGFVPTASFSPTPVSVAAQADPYSGASVTHGSCSGGDSAIVLSGSQTASPGTYASLGAGSGGTLNLAPGTYTITGSFTNVSGGTITGNGVTLYFCPGAGLSLSGASSTTLSSPTGSSGFVLFFDPSSAGTFSALADTARFTGIVYAKSAALQLNAFDVQGDVVADTVDIHSGGAVHITSGSTPPPPPPQKTTPTLTTTASGPVTVGTSIHDTAHLSGGSNPTGAITFDLYDSTCTTKLTTVAATTSVNGNGDYVSAGYTPSAAGTYKWAAHYSGDANNNGVDVACGAPNESSTVNAASTPPGGGGGGGGGGGTTSTGGGGGGGGGGGSTSTSTPTANTTNVPATTPSITVPTTTAPKVDLAIAKSASPTNLLVGKPTSYTLKVTNRGPITDTNVQVSDVLPAGVDYDSVTSSQGTCTGGKHIVCRIGTMTNGQVVTIEVGVKTNAVGTIVNTATVTGALPERTLANNEASATIRVKAPFTPPVVQKKAKVKKSPPPCLTLSVVPKNLTAGHTGTLQLRVKAKTKPVAGVHVAISGGGVQVLSGPTNGHGQVSLALHPTKAGIVSLRAAKQKACNTAHVGVISVFTPPITG